LKKIRKQFFFKEAKAVPHVRDCDNEAMRLEHTMLAFNDAKEKLA